MPEQPNNAFSQVVDFLESRRKQQQDVEDQQINSKIALIHDLITSPGANPARTAEGLSNLMDLYAAKGGRTKPSKGEGPWGKHDTPDPSLLAGIIHGTIPYEGPTTEAVPQPQSPAQQGLMPEASAQLPGLTRTLGGTPDPSTAAHQEGFSGQSVLNSPVMVPPQPLQAPPDASRMLSAARQMQQYNDGPKTRPVANQPMMKSHEEQAQEVANDAALKASTALTANMEAEFKTLVGMGTDPAQAKLAVAEKYGLKPQTAAQKPTKGPIMEYKDPRDGTVKRTQSWLQLQPDGSTKALDSYGLALPLDAQPVQNTGASSPYTTHWEQDAKGVWHVSYAAKDPNANFQPQTLTTGMTGHLPAPPTFVYDTPDPEHPGQTVPVVRPKVVTPNAPGGTAPNTNPPKAQKLGTEDQSFVNTAQGIQKTMDRINKSIEAEGLQNANSIKDWGSQQAQNWWRKQGFEPAKFNADLQQRVGYLRATLLRSLLGGRPNKYVTEIFQSHLPAEFQTPAQIYNTMKLIRQEIQDRYDGIQAGHGGQALPALGGSKQQGNAEFKQFLDALKKK